VWGRARCARRWGRLPWSVVHPPASGPDWLGLTDQPLPVGAVYEWCVQDQCGAVVVFSGTVRDHAVDEQGTLRRGVGFLTYEAYDEQVVPKLAAIVAELRSRWPHTGRVAVLHRTGRIELGESSVIAAVSSPHRPEAFEAARFAIDAVKATAPIWKHEVWDDGADWGTGAHAPVAAADVLASPAVDESPAPLTTGRPQNVGR
jgi:molybdopterin synthase catalytic subunit